MSPRRSRRALTALCAAAAIPAAALAAPGIAAATPMIDSSTIALTDMQSIGSYHMSGTDLYSIVGYDLDVSASASWSGSVPTTVGWNSSYLRQGAAPGVSRMASLTSGQLHVSFKVKGKLIKAVDSTDVNQAFGADVSCAPMLSGSNYTCTATSGQWAIYRETGIPNGHYVNVQFRAKFTVTPTGAIASRKLSVAGSPDATKSGLPLTPTLHLDYPDIPCGTIGNPVYYKLDWVGWKPPVSVTQNYQLTEGFLDPLAGGIELPANYTKNGLPHTFSPPFFLAGAGHSINLGPLQRNDVAPTITSVTPTTTYRGAPTTFAASVTSRCPIKGYVWHFDDGEISYGATPSRTFDAPGVYAGKVEVQDASGLTALHSFSVTVS